MLPAATVDHLARLYEHELDARFRSTKLFPLFSSEVDKWFAKIPVPVEWVFDKQPFETSGQMRKYVEQNGVLRMYAARSFLGETYHKHRAVHDWFGHIVPGIPFGVDGELESYRLHQEHYPAIFHPILFSDVVLHNAYFERHGEWFPREKWVLIDDKEVL